MRSIVLLWTLMCAVLSHGAVVASRDATEFRLATIAVRIWRCQIVPLITSHQFEINSVS